LGEALNRLAQAPDLNTDKARGMPLTCAKFAHSTAEFSGKQAEVLSATS